MLLPNTLTDLSKLPVYSLPCGSSAAIALTFEPGCAASLPTTCGAQLVRLLAVQGHALDMNFRFAIKTLKHPAIYLARGCAEKEGCAANCCRDHMCTAPPNGDILVELSGRLESIQNFRFRPVCRRERDTDSQLQYSTMAHGHATCNQLLQQCAVDTASKHQPPNHLVCGTP